MSTKTLPPASDTLLAELGSPARAERLSLSSELVAWVRETAAAAGCTVSRVIEVALRREQTRQQDGGER